MLPILTTALLALVYPGTQIQPPPPANPAAGVIPGGPNRGTYKPPPLTLVMRKLAVEALFQSVPKLRDFVGPQPHNPYLYIPWESKVAALLDLQQGNDKEYKLILKKITQKRDEAKERSARYAKDAAGIAKYLNNPGLRPDAVRSWSDTLASAKRSESLWQTIYIGKSKEGEILEAMGQAVIKARLAKRAPSP